MTSSVSTSIAKTKSSGTVTARCRPSSPRRFFARLYGHLNDVDAKNDGDETRVPDNNRIPSVDEQIVSRTISTATPDNGREPEKLAKKLEQRKTLNRDYANEIRRVTEFFDDSPRRKLVHNRSPRESLSFGIDKRRTICETAKREDGNYFDHNRDERSKDINSGICAPSLVSTRLFMCRGFSAPIDIHPAAAAASVAATDVAISTSGSVLPASNLHQITHMGHQLHPPAPFSQLHGDLQVETHLHGFSSFLARRRKKESRPRRQRTTYSGEQTARLEYEYRRGEYISQKRRSELAQTLNLTETQIKIWFQNRRAKYKRINKAMLDQHYRNIVVSNGLVNFPVCTGAGAFLGDLSFCQDNGEARCTANNLVAIMTRDKERRRVGDAVDKDNVSTYRCNSSGSEECSERVVSPL